MQSLPYGVRGPFGALGGVYSTKFYADPHGTILLGHKDEGACPFRLRRRNYPGIIMDMDVLLEDLIRLWACMVGLMADRLRFRVEIDTTFYLLDHGYRAGIHTDMLIQNCHDEPL